MALLILGCEEREPATEQLWHKDQQMLDVSALTDIQIQQLLALNPGATFWSPYPGVNVAHNKYLRISGGLNTSNMLLRIFVTPAAIAVDGVEYSIEGYVTHPSWK
jgi:hypothetical protein